MLTREQILNLVGEFTWDFGSQFYIATEQGNFVWSCPDYNGDNSLIPTDKTYVQWIESDKGHYGRDKGTHIIGQYIGWGSLA
jgi:hypothetical protein